MAAIFRITRIPEANETIKGAFGELGDQKLRQPPAAAAAAPGAPPNAVQGYMDRLIKLIPAEVVGIYLVGTGVIPKGEDVSLIVWAIVWLGLVIAVRAYGTSDSVARIPPQWSAVAVSSVSFGIWVYNMPGPFQVLGLAVPYIGSLLVLVWTFLVPIFYKG